MQFVQGALSSLHLLLPPASKWTGDFYRNNLNVRDLAFLLKKRKRKKLLITGDVPGTNLR